MLTRIAETESFEPADSAQAEPFDPLSNPVIRQLWRTLAQLGVPAESVPDAVQDALLVLHRRRSQLRPNVAPTTWIYGVALRVASDYRRKARRFARIFEGTSTRSELGAVSAGPSPFEHLLAQEANRILYRVLDKLPSEQRDVFVLVELEELSLSTVAEALRISESTCKGRLQRARLAFNGLAERERQRLEREGSV